MASYQYFVVGITDTSRTDTLSCGYETRREAESELPSIEEEQTPFPYQSVWVKRYYYHWS
jgi:hypothetical protein